MGLLDGLQNIKGLLSDWYDGRVRAASGLIDDVANAPNQLGLLFDPKWQAEMRKPENMAKFDQSTKDLGWNIAGMFAGPLAKTADLAALKTAEAMKAKGIPDQQIHKETGWFFGMPDGKPRFEIPDNQAAIEKTHPMSWLTEMSPMGKDIPLEQAKELSKKYNAAIDQVNMFGSGNGVMPSMLLHRDLYSAYPDLTKTRVSFDAMGTPYGGSYDEARNAISLARGNLGNEAKGKSTTLHELQHAIQEREGWERGGSPDQILSELKISSPELYASYERTGELGKLGFNRYNRLVGEAEARLTQSRMNMTPEQRAASYPPSMFDVPVEQQIVRGLLNN